MPATQVIKENPQYMDQPIYLLIQDWGGSVETDTRHQPNENEVREKAPPPSPPPPPFLHAARRTHKGLAKLQVRNVL